MKAHADDRVEVLSKEEVLTTLDKNGRFDEFPFMPQMFRHCGHRFRIFKAAHKTCDTVSGHYAGRCLQDGYHLSIRCDGQAYGGCQAGCLIFWKGAWLKRVDGPAQVQYVAKNDNCQSEKAASLPRCTERDVLDAMRRQDAGGDARYSCQATELLNFTKLLPWWDARQYCPRGIHLWWREIWLERDSVDAFPWVVPPNFADETPKAQV